MSKGHVAFKKTCLPFVSIIYTVSMEFEYSWNLTS